MITEDYATFEVAKLLKEKGFDETCRAFWKEWNGEINLCDCNSSHTFEYYHNTMLERYNDDEELNIAAPTLQMAMKWLREKHNKIIVPGISLDDRTSGTINHYIVGIWYIHENNGGAFCYTSPTPYEGYPSFEEACEDAIRYCLENLI